MKGQNLKIMGLKLQKFSYKVKYILMHKSKRLRDTGNIAATIISEHWMDLMSGTVLNITNNSLIMGTSGCDLSSGIDTSGLLDLSLLMNIVGSGS